MASSFSPPGGSRRRRARGRAGFAAGRAVARGGRSVTVEAPACASASSTRGSKPIIRSSEPCERAVTWRRGRGAWGSSRTPRATSPATAPPAPGSFARSRRTSRSSACGCSAGHRRHASSRCAPGSPGRSTSASSCSTSASRCAARVTRRALRVRRPSGAPGYGAVCSAHNVAVDSYPWRFASVVSVAQSRRGRSRRLYYNPEPPVEFLRAASTSPSPGSAAGRSARPATASRHRTSRACSPSSARRTRRLTPFELKSVLYRIAANVRDPA